MRRSRAGRKTTQAESRRDVSQTRMSGVKGQRIRGAKRLKGKVISGLKTSR